MAPHIRPWALHPLPLFSLQTDSVTDELISLGPIWPFSGETLRKVCQERWHSTFCSHGDHSCRRALQWPLTERHVWSSAIVPPWECSVSQGIECLPRSGLPLCDWPAVVAAGRRQRGRRLVTEGAVICWRSLPGPARKY